MKPQIELKLISDEKYKKLVEYCKVDIRLSKFMRISQNHSNLCLPQTFEEIINHGRFIDFCKVLDAMLLYPEQDFNSFQKGQLESKKWLIHNLNKLKPKHSPDILIVGGWHGVLALMLEHYAYFEFMCLTTDIDPDCTSIADMFGCHAETEDMFEIDYEMISQDMIINTSCEHIDFDQWIKLIPEGKIVALQTTDMKWESHIDNIYSIKEFINRAKLSKIYIFDEINLDGAGQNYNRYLLIGKK